MERPNPGVNQVDNQSELESVIDQVKAGDQQAYTIVIRKFEKKIYTYCYCMLKNREEAQDAVQEIFIKAYQEIHRYGQRISFSAWLYKMAYHHCLDQIRKQNRWKRLVTLYQEKQHHSFDNHTEQAVTELLMHLNREERNILLLKIVEQYSFEEMGQIMDCKPATLRKKYERLRKKLIEQNKHEGGIAREGMPRTN